MAAQPMIAGLPPDLSLYAGCIIRVRLIDPVTGAAIAGGVLSNVSIFIRNIGGSTLDELVYGDWRLVPGPGA